jgi:hypothetical protein
VVNQELAQSFLQVSAIRVVHHTSLANWTANPSIGGPSLQTTDVILHLVLFHLISAARHLKTSVLRSIDLLTLIIIAKLYLQIIPLNDVTTMLSPRIFEEMIILDLLIPMDPLALPSLDQTIGPHHLRNTERRNTGMSYLLGLHQIIAESPVLLTTVGRPVHCLLQVNT